MSGFKIGAIGISRSWYICEMMPQGRERPMKRFIRGGLFSETEDVVKIQFLAKTFEPYGIAADVLIRGMIVSDVTGHFEIESVQKLFSGLLEAPHEKVQVLLSLDSTMS